MANGDWSRIQENKVISKAVFDILKGIGYRREKEHAIIQDQNGTPSNVILGIKKQVDFTPKLSEMYTNGNYPDILIHLHGLSGSLGISEED